MMLADMETPRHELAALIDRVRDANNWSDMDIAKRANAAGHKLGKSNLSRIRNTDVVSITGSTIRGLAAGLGVPEAEVARAALMSMGIELPEIGGLDLATAIKLEPSIPVREKQMLLSVLHAIQSTAPHPSQILQQLTSAPAQQTTDAFMAAFSAMSREQRLLTIRKLKSQMEEYTAQLPQASASEQPPFDRSRLLAAMSEPDQEDRAGKPRRSPRSKVDLEPEANELRGDQDSHGR